MFDGKILRRIRKAEGLTQAEFGGIVGVTSCHISRLESNNNLPSIRFLQKVERLFHCRFEITCRQKISEAVV